eukprot:scaffold1311_cov256-Pinguiococcus_pyrenoidosus.AAC.63
MVEATRISPTTKTDITNNSCYCYYYCYCYCYCYCSCSSSSKRLRIWQIRKKVVDPTSPAHLAEASMDEESGFKQYRKPKQGLFATVEGAVAISLSLIRSTSSGLADLRGGVLLSS